MACTVSHRTFCKDLDRAARKCISEAALTASPLFLLLEAVEVGQGLCLQGVRLCQLMTVLGFTTKRKGPAFPADAKHRKCACCLLSPKQICGTDSVSWAPWPPGFAMHSSAKSIYLLAGRDCLRGCQCYPSNGCALPIRALPAALHSMPFDAGTLLLNKPVDSYPGIVQCFAPIMSKILPHK